MLLFFFHFRKMTNVNCLRESSDYEKKYSISSFFIRIGSRIPKYVKYHGAFRT